jgi:hypothetical protein
MVAESLALQAIFQELNRLPQRLRQANTLEERVQLLKEMRLLLGDADKIIGSEMGDN